MVTMQQLRQVASTCSTLFLYTLKLRPEYDFNWSDDEIEITYENGGKYYSKKFNGLNSLFASPNIQLIEE